MSGETAPLRGQRVQNWKGDIVYHASSVETIRTVAQLQAIVRNRARYPSPIRAKGSHHSTTRCVDAEGGTVADMSEYNSIVSIDEEALTITAQAGVLLIDAARSLAEKGLQFHTNLEIGNLTLGSAATGNTKDASLVIDGAREPGQFCSYCVGMRVVTPDGSLRHITEENNGDLLTAMRTGYGMLGIAYEVTFRIKKLSGIDVEHEAYSVDEFAARLPELAQRDASLMLYMFPFLDKVVVEYKRDTKRPPGRRALVWRIRNYMWSSLWPFVANVLYFLPASVRFWVTDLVGRFTIWAMVRLLRAKNTNPVAQINRYPERAGFSSVSFSIWAVPLTEFPDTIRKYFAFVKTYNRDNGYRVDVLDLCYLVAKDRSSLFSYSREWDAMSIDPVATGRGRWREFLKAYNEFCSEKSGKPLLNQTGQLTPDMVKQAFGNEVAEFERIRREIDPSGRFINKYFQDFLSEVERGNEACED